MKRVHNDWGIRSCTHKINQLNNNTEIGGMQDVANKKNKVNLTVEDVKELVMIVAQVHDKGHFASIDFSNHGYNVSIWFKRGGFTTGEGFDFSRDFNLSDKNEDIDAYLEVVDYLLTVLEEKDGTLTEL